MSLLNNLSTARRTTFIAFLITIICFGQTGRSQNLENYTHKLNCSTTTTTVWTGPASIKILKSTAAPSISENAVKVYAAKNEFEPFLVVVKPTTAQNLKISMAAFTSGIDCEIFQVRHIQLNQATDALGQTGSYPDPLYPIANNATISLNANENTVFWVNVKVGKNVASKTYTANFGVGSIQVPIDLHVFNFAISDELHVQSQMNFSYQSMLDKYGVTGTSANYWTYVEKIKQWFIDHRLTPSSVLWSGGLTSGGEPYISYDGAGTLSDKDGIWGFEEPAARYLKGTGLMKGTYTSTFNEGTGFPSFMAMTFKTNDPSADQRPTSFYGVTRSGEWDKAGDAYNTKWFQYISSIESYLSQQTYLDKAYYYFANEPQDQADYDAIAWYAQKLKAAAPKLKLMVSEEPKTEIYNNAKYGAAKIDIWLPVLHQFNPTASLNRLKNNQEESWIYFLKSTSPPYFNPITIDHPGIESKFTGWFLWKYRLRGIAYYSMNKWSANPWTNPMENTQNGEVSMFYPPSESNTNISYGATNHRFVSSIRFELLRDGLEDYEYLYLLAGNRNPAAEVVNTADGQVDKIIKGVSSYIRDDKFMYNLRRVIGLYLGGEISALPDLNPESQGTVKAHYINFQDLSKGPTASPLVVSGATYSKIGWDAFDDSKGYGWFSPSDAHWMGTYLSDATVNELQRSIIYSDYGRAATFMYKLASGKYNVSVSVGWKGKSYPHNYIKINGTVFVNDENNNGTYIVRTKELNITDGILSMEMGTAGDYTMLNYLKIEPVVTTDIKNEPTSKSYKIYPNPSSGQVYIDLNPHCSLKWQF